MDIFVKKIVIFLKIFIINIFNLFNFLLTFIILFCGFYNKNIIIAFITMCVFIILDYYSKVYAVTKEFGSFKKAKQKGYWNSQKLKNKTLLKIMLYSIVISTSLITINLLSSLLYNSTKTFFKEFLIILTFVNIIKIEYNSIKENIFYDLKTKDKNKKEEGLKEIFDMLDDKIKLINNKQNRPD